MRQVGGGTDYSVFGNVNLIRIVRLHVVVCYIRVLISYLCFTLLETAGIDTQEIAENGRKGRNMHNPIWEGAKQ